MMKGQEDSVSSIAQFPEEDRKSRFEPDADLIPGKLLYIRYILNNIYV